LLSTGFIPGKETFRELSAERIFEKCHERQYVETITIISRMVAQLDFSTMSSQTIQID